MCLLLLSWKGTVDLCGMVEDEVYSNCISQTIPIMAGPLSALPSQ